MTWSLLQYDLFDTIVLYFGFVTFCFALVSFVLTLDNVFDSRDFIGHDVIEIF